ncbi:MAG: ABC transporter substrate-binding protein [Marinobacterium sp.]|nr:ABC transporter substrate-binding protein [Marinobacterium sp.]
MMQVVKRMFLTRWLVMTAVLFCFSSVGQAGWDEAAGAVDTATRDVLKVLDNEGLKEEARFDELLGEIDQALSPVVDFDYIARRVMGKYYRRASADQREQFSDVFKTTLLKTYARALLGFQIESYRIVKPAKESPKPEKQAVSVVVKSANGTEYTVVYFMLKRNDRWSLVNASMDGINLRLTFKNQFANMAQEHKGKVGSVITAWRNSIDGKVGQEG